MLWGQQWHSVEQHCYWVTTSDVHYQSWSLDKMSRIINRIIEISILQTQKNYEKTILDSFPNLRSPSLPTEFPASNFHKIPNKTETSHAQQLKKFKTLTSASRSVEKAYLNICSWYNTSKLNLPALAHEKCCGDTVLISPYYMSPCPRRIPGAW